MFKKYSNKNKKSKLIHISTDEVYGDIVKGKTNENVSLLQAKSRVNLSPYAASKASCNKIICNISYVRTCINTKNAIKYYKLLQELWAHNNTQKN